MTLPPEDLVSWARNLAARYLDTPQFAAARWPHVQAVAAKAAALAPAYGDDGEVLIAAAWLHDIGYSPDLTVTGFHPLDGGQCLLHMGADRIAALVAHHSGAALEAELRGLAAPHSVFLDESSPVRDALWTCDMTTSPTGQPVTFPNRLAEIINRYGAEHTVPRAINAAADDITRAITVTQHKTTAAGITITL